MSEGGQTQTTVAGLARETGYVVYVRAQDQAGNRSAVAQKAVTTRPPSFTMDVVPFIQNSCSNSGAFSSKCHPSSYPTIPTTYDPLVNNHAPASACLWIDKTNATDPTKSFIYAVTQAAACGHTYMPPALASPDIVKDWILEGANNN